MSGKVWLWLGVMQLLVSLLGRGLEVRLELVLDPGFVFEEGLGGLAASRWLKLLRLLIDVAHLRF